ncbi:MAG: flagellar hook protein FlgE [Lawsonibacter sp.]|nr:flagellar hook protein FlgE [Lawsonibacter sp.]
MTGAMYAAIGGLKAHMSNLNVIGNNIANCNTYGYKAQRMTFKESMYTTSRSGSNGGTTAGGNNPSQIGYGCSVGSIDLNMAPSTYAPTGYGLDCYIDGEGFMIVGDKLTWDPEANGGDGAWVGGITKGSEVKNYDLTRVGDLWVDPDGYVCNRDGKVVYGYARVQNPDYKLPDDPDTRADNEKSETIISTHLVPLRVPLSAAKPTADNGGVTGTGADAKNLWEEGDPVYPYLSPQGTNQYANPGDEATPATDAAATGAGKTGVAVAENTDPLATSSVMPIQLKNMNVEKNGAITGIAANGDTVILGYIAIASVDSPDGVSHIDGPYYRAMGGAGNVRVSGLGIDPYGDGKTAYLGNKGREFTGAAANRDGAEANDAILNEKSTEMKSGGLESSSTDIATEFAGMITTQRGYQANTRIITVTDSMLEELVNMKR